MKAPHMAYFISISDTSTSTKKKKNEVTGWEIQNSKKLYLSLE